MFDRQAEALSHPLRHQRAVARLGIALDAEEGGSTAFRQLGGHRIEVGMVEDLARVALCVLARDPDARALTHALTVVLAVLELPQLGGGRQLEVVLVLDPRAREGVLEAPRIRPRVLSAAHAAALAHVEEEADFRVMQCCQERFERPAIHTNRQEGHRVFLVDVDVIYEERYWYPEDGGQVWLVGYQLVDRASDRYLARDAPELRERGLRVAGVAGASQHHSEALGEAPAPGEALELRRDPNNEHDPNAIAVHVPGGAQLGWVPREIAAELAPEMDAGRPWCAVVLREQRASPRDPRTGLTMLLAPDGHLRLRSAGP